MNKIERNELPNSERLIEAYLKIEKRLVINLVYLLTGDDLTILDKVSAIEILDNPESSKRKRKNALDFADRWKEKTLKETTILLNQD